MLALQDALAAVRRDYAERNPKSLKAFEEAAHHLPGGNTRSTLFAHPFPLFIAKGHSNQLEDVDGHAYTDFMSDYTSGIYGKTHPVLRQAILDGLEDGLQLGAITGKEARMAALIKQRFPSMELLRFTNSGTEANIMAISTALRFTQRKKVVVFEGGYHGGCLSAFRLKDEGTSRAPETNVLQVPFDFIVLPYNDEAAAEAELIRNAHDIGAVLVEPMLGSGGCVPGDPAFLRLLRRLTAEHGMILIMDEVQTARLSYGGRQGSLGISPDMTTLGKFFGGGFAFGSFGGRKDIMELFDSRKPGAIGHGGTFNGSPLTMAAGAAALERILTPEALDQLNALGDQLRNSLNKTFHARHAPYEVTGLGSLNQIHCTLPPPTKQLGGDLLFFELLQSGFWLAQRGLLCTSLETTEAQAEQLVRAVDRILVKHRDTFP